jgi:hypothetical protein
MFSYKIFLIEFLPPPLFLLLVLVLLFFFFFFFLNATKETIVQICSGKQKG